MDPLGIRRWLQPRADRRFLQLDEHFRAHGIAMGLRSREEYLAQAQQLVETAFHNATVAYFRHVDGTLYLYQASTTEFALVNTFGEIITYYKPSSRRGRKHGYWEHQKWLFGRQGLIVDDGYGG